MKKFNIEELKKEIERIGYYPTEELLYDTFNAICLFDQKELTPGQDIYAICLDGPPGAGKTSFAETYTKLAANILEEEVEFVEYQCDPTTGKGELFEDINIGAAISHDPENVNIPGYLLKAIKKVSEGKKVILFLDEYDKAREETDSFFLQLLQKGKINTTQHGDIEIPEEYKSNLQVIFCRNDMREELSGPLTRRLRLLTLDYMTPELFYKVAHRNLIEDAKKPVSEGLLNMVSLMYQAAYVNRTVYNRLPAASEMMIAITDAHRLITLADAPQHIIYRTITKNMFKSPSDLITFEGNVEKGKKEEEKKLKELIKDMKKSEDATPSNLNELIAEKVLKDESKNIVAKEQELKELLEEYKAKFKDMEEKRKQTIQAEVDKIKLQQGELVSTTSIPNIIRVFEDEQAYIKRGLSVFETSKNEWTDISSCNFNFLSHHDLYEYYIQNAANLGIVIYENGILLDNQDGIKLILINDYDENDNIRYRFLCNYPVIPPKFLEEIEEFIKLSLRVYDKQAKTANTIINEAVDMSVCQLDVNTLVYMGNGSMYNIAYEEIEEGIAHVEHKYFIRRDDDFKLIGGYGDIDSEDLKVAASKLDKGKVLINE